MRDYIETQIADRREALSQLERQKIALQGELRAYEDMRQKLASERVGSQEQRGSAGAKAQSGKPSDDDGGETSPIRLTANWLNTLLALRNDFREFTGEDVLKAAESVGYETNLINIRSQLSSYTERGLLIRKTLGRYEIADVLHARLDAEQDRKISRFDNLEGSPSNTNKGSDAETPEPLKVPVPQSTEDQSVFD